MACGRTFVRSGYRSTPEAGALSHCRQRVAALAVNDLIPLTAQVTSLTLLGHCRPGILHARRSGCPQSTIPVSIATFTVTRAWQLGAATISILVDG